MGDRGVPDFRSLGRPVELHQRLIARRLLEVGGLLGHESQQRPVDRLQSGAEPLPALCQHPVEPCAQGRVGQLGTQDDALVLLLDVLGDLGRDGFSYRGVGLLEGGCAASRGPQGLLQQPVSRAVGKVPVGEPAHLWHHRLERLRHLCLHGRRRRRMQLGPADLELLYLRPHHLAEGGRVGHHRPHPRHCQQELTALRLQLSPDPSLCQGAVPTDSARLPGRILRQLVVQGPSAKRQPHNRDPRSCPQISRVLPDLRRDEGDETVLSGPQRRRAESPQAGGSGGRPAWHPLAQGPEAAMPTLELHATRPRLASRANRTH
mmetsp:Transcript_48065/g.139235  ORF Transcript_48065/g.139235 Transcript_48065/m.139235 type:complete len:319 (+) Transcript_48065:565-1521(+)